MHIVYSHSDILGAWLLQTCVAVTAGGGWRTMAACTGNGSSAPGVLLLRAAAVAAAWRLHSLKQNYRGQPVLQPDLLFQYSILIGWWPDVYSLWLMMVVMLHCYLFDYLTFYLHSTTLLIPSADILIEKASTWEAEVLYSIQHSQLFCWWLWWLEADCDQWHSDVPGEQWLNVVLWWLLIFIPMTWYTMHSLSDIYQVMTFFSSDLWYIHSPPLMPAVIRVILMLFDIWWCVGGTFSVVLCSFILLTIFLCMMEIHWCWCDACCVIVFNLND